MSAAPIDIARRAFVAGTGAALLCAAGITGARAATSRRVVVVGGAICEIVYALGAEQQLVGSDTTCTYPDAARHLPRVGYQRALSAEGLLSLRPDLVLASAEAGPPIVLAQLDKAGVSVQRLPEQHDVDTVRDKIRGVAAALDATAAGHSLLARFDREWKAARQAVAVSRTLPPTRAPRVVFVLSRTGPQALVAGQHTAANAMLAYAGARNAMQGFDGYRPLTAEALVAAAPDYVVTIDAGGTPETARASLASMPGFAGTPAGRAGRIITFDPLFFLGFGPRLPAAVVELNRQLSIA